MAFIAQKTHPSGSQSKVHQVARLEISGARATCVVNSFATIDAFELEYPALNWQDAYEVPLEHVADAEAWLVSPAGPFSGGTVMTASTPLAKAQERRWADLKQRRNELEAAGFLYRGQLLDSDPTSVLRMTVARAEAEDAVEEGDTSYEKVWICADNSPLVLDAVGVIGMLPALAAYGTQLHDIAQGLRAAIGEAQTPAEVEAISWPI